MEPPMTLPTPDYPQDRQFILGMLDYHLQLPPTNRGPLDELAKLIASGVPAWQLDRWPQAAALWV
jgi:hypothetical protein